MEAGNDCDRADQEEAKARLENGECVFHTSLMPHILNVDPKMHGRIEEAGSHRSSGLRVRDEARDTRTNMGILAARIPRAHARKAYSCQKRQGPNINNRQQSPKHLGVSIQTCTLCATSATFVKLMREESGRRKLLLSVPGKYPSPAIPNPAGGGSAAVLDSGTST
eukprot:gnl/TRDRNA2_/TRDRNA2_87818_c0_seq3.p3 gnl/TRDRNA2_/TRDRNA2_87818_c0~~gnl/TRDRNA2_/TRDRNA2_87818_c0_seq3.p3  ORF type:complete len:166 (-),score=16.34 gnl/TRDRNA2_/TRDRNA2_87818_c0_seq3:151-648(-)